MKTVFLLLSVLGLLTVCNKPDPITKNLSVRKTITIWPAVLRPCTAPLLALDNSEHDQCICLHEERVYWEPCTPRRDEPCAP